MYDGRENPVKAKVCGSEDHISQLPDEVLTKILSFLPLKTIIRTGILSKRWKPLWASVLSIELNVLDFLPRGEGLNRIRRSTNLRYPLVRLNSYRFEKLVCLELSGDIPFDIPVSISFPKLKTLHLQDIISKDKYSIPNLINSCCPVLENLYVYSNDNLSNLSGLVISVRTLKQLEIDVLRCDDFDTITGIRIDVPALEYLSLRNVLTLGNDDVAGALGALVEANLDIDIEDENSYDFFRLFRRICNVKMLTLSETTWLPLDIHILPTFCNLTHLEIKESEVDSDNSFSWEVLVKILKRSPKLENLCLVELPFDLESVWTIEDDVPECLTECLKTLEISSFIGDKLELAKLGYFLKHSKVLEKMKVTIGKECSRRRNAKKKIFRMPKGSPECEIIVMYTS